MRGSKRSWLVGIAAVVGMMACSAAAQEPLLAVRPALLEAPGTVPATSVQGIALDRRHAGTRIDGSGSAGLLGSRLAVVGGDGGRRALGVVDMLTGAAVIRDTDLALASIGPAWVVGRTYGSGVGASTQYQGRGWMHSGQSELVFVPGQGEAPDVVHLVTSAHEYTTYERIGSSSIFRGVNGAAGAMQVSLVSDELGAQHELCTLWLPDGNAALFFGFAAAPAGVDLPPSKQSTASHRLGLDQGGPQRWVGSVTRRKRS